MRMHLTNRKLVTNSSPKLPGFGVLLRLRFAENQGEQKVCTSECEFHTAEVTAPNPVAPRMSPEAARKS